MSGAEEIGEAGHSVALFSRDAAAIRMPDALRLAADPPVDAALRADLAAQLLEHLTAGGNPVIAPALGDGGTQLAAEATGRRCWVAEPERSLALSKAWYPGRVPRLARSGVKLGRPEINIPE